MKESWGGTPSVFANLPEPTQSRAEPLWKIISLRKPPKINTSMEILKTEMSKQVWEPIHLTWILKWFTPCRVIQINHTTRPQHRSLSLVLVLITSCKKQLFSSWGRHLYHVHILNLICEQANVGSMDWTRLKEELKLTEMSPRATKIILLHFEGANCHCINPTESQNHAPSDGPPWDPISEKMCTVMNGERQIA